MRIRLKYVSEDVDRHGNPRCYLRMPGRPKVRLRSMPGTPEFMLEYQEALSGSAVTTTTKPKPTAFQRGTFRHLCVQYFKSGEYSALDVSTKNWQRRALERICETHGSNLVSHMQARHVRKLRDELLATPAAANGRLKALRALFNWANEADETTVNPTLGVKRIKYASDGHHTWTDAEIAQYQKRHPAGTKARLAFDLLRYIAFRREDVVRIGPEHIHGGRVTYRQAKNEDRNPVDLDIPLHPDLEASIAAATRSDGSKTFLLTEFGKAFTANGFGNKFKDWCRQADLPHCSAHGIRKATATALAENAATPHEIMSITGHRSIEEVERYTKAARMRMMANAAMAKLSPPREAAQNLSHRAERWDNSRRKAKENKGRIGVWRSLGESNPCFSLERAAS
ncbi:MAG: phage integrase [Nitrobacter sp.]